MEMRILGVTPSCCQPLPNTKYDILCEYTHRFVMQQRSGGVVWRQPPGGYLAALVFMAAIYGAVTSTNAQSTQITVGHTSGLTGRISSS
jgi:hypothetical protein